MKKLFLSIILFSLLSVIFVPVLASADGLVPCTGSNCTICSFFQMLANIYNLIVKDIATPLAIIAIIVGAIFMMVSAGNPNLMSKGKTIFWSAIIGLALVFCSYLIIDSILHAIGYSQSWTNLQMDCPSSGSGGGYQPGPEGPQG